MKSKSLPGVCVFLLLLSLGFNVACSRSTDDAQIAGEVQGKLSSNSNLQGKQIQIQSSNGVVTLSGTVASDFERMAAANDAAQVEGVRTVVNNLQVEEMMGHAPAMAEAHTAAEAAQGSKPSPSRVTVPASQTAPVQQPGRVREFDEAAAAPPQLPAGQSSPALPPPSTAVARRVEIAQGTEIAVRLIDSLDTETAQAGDTFRASLSAPVVVDGETVIPANADVEGQVVEAKSAGRFAGQSLLTLELTRLVVNGRNYDLQTTAWTKQASSTGKATATKVGIGSALGAIVGGIAGGGKGAAIGAAAGAGAGTGVQAAKGGEEIKLPVETPLSFALESSLSVTPATTRSR